jgi:LAO/AO transport system kinase
MVATPIPSLDLVPDVLAGRPRAIARLISRIEAGPEGCRAALAEVYRHTGKAHVVGITGVPGSGKSTLVRALALAARAAEHKVGIVAVDPSSPFTGGSILGDRIRMLDLTGDPNIFIRSMATRGALGGLARASLDAVDVLDAAGYDLVLIETVGVGQDEVDVVRAAHTTVVVSAPGLGDDIQAIKAGILEIADIHVVSKSDRPDANKTIAELKLMLMLAAPSTTSDAWQVPVLATSAAQREGIGELLAMLVRHRAMLQTSGEWDRRRQRIAETRILKTAEDIIRSRFNRQRHQEVGRLVGHVTDRELDPYTAALALLTQLEGDSSDG